MTKAELVTAIAEQAGLNKDPRRKMRLTHLHRLGDRLAQGRQGRSPGGFWQFASPCGARPSIARNPRTGAQVKRAASTTARFRIGESLKHALN